MGAGSRCERSGRLRSVRSDLMATYLFKTEPSEYSFADLVRDGKAEWSGITNAAALIHLRRVKRGDEVFIYHTGDEKRIVGLAKVVSGVREDAKRPGKTPSGEAKFAVVDIAPVRAAKTPLTLAAMKGDQRFAGFMLLTHGRWSVMPVGEDVDGLIRKLAGI